ncbi:MAG: G8 domain-containing protein [Pseudomonadota bacterium]
MLKELIMAMAMTMGMHAAGHNDGPAMKLVSIEQVTHSAVRSGDWSDPGVWSNGVPPGEGARAHIPAGMTVRVDGQVAPEIKTLRIDGALTFKTDVNTELKVDTLVTSVHGLLEIGTSANPIDADVTAKIVFADDGVIDRDWDPSLISRGALLHGKTVIHGAEKAGFAALASKAAKGAQTLTLKSAPTGWKVGDEIVIAATDPSNPTGDETRIVTAINGSTITLNRPLDLDHLSPRADLDVHVANLTRNVTFDSENDGALQRGHVMFMHTNDADLRYVAFEDLGRTDKSKILDDWQLVSGNEESIGAENTELEYLGGANVRGRYSVHFHRGGTDGDGKPAHVEGAVVSHDPGWGYVNHSSNVNFIDNVSYDVLGSAYNTEAGDEIGSFIGNIALRTVNPNAALNPFDDEVDPDQAPDARAERQDYGWQGDGFWFHGAGVTVDDNVVAGASGHAYIYWKLGLVEEGLGENLVDVANLPNGAMIGPDGTMVRTKHVPVPSFDGNLGYGAEKGLQIHYLHTDHRDLQDKELAVDQGLAVVPQAYEETLKSTFSNSTFWNVGLSGVETPYSTRIAFDRIEVIGTGKQSSIGFDLGHFAVENNVSGSDLTASGFLIGLNAPRQGLARFDGLTLANETDIQILTPDRHDRDLVIRDVTHAALPASLAGADRQKVLMNFEEALEAPLIAEFLANPEEFAEEDEELAEFLLEDFGVDGSELSLEDLRRDFDGDGFAGVLPAVLRLDDRIVYQQTGGAVQGLYYDEQSRSFIPFKRGGDLAPITDERLLGLTNAELQDQFGISVGGFAAPRNAQPSADVLNGLVGTPRPALGSDADFGGGDPLPTIEEFASGEADLEEASVNIMRGTAEDDRMKGTAGSDQMNGLGGADTLKAMGGADTLNGGGGEDRLLAGVGDDVVLGRQGADTLRGGAGADTLKGGGGADRIFAGSGDDRLVGVTGDDSLRGGLGDDTLIGAGGDDNLAAHAGDDLLRGGGGNDTLNGGGGDDTMVGGAGSDQFVFIVGRAGRDLIEDFTKGEDRLAVKGAPDQFTFADLTITQGEAGAEVSFGDGVAVLRNVEASVVGSEDFIF